MARFQLITIEVSWDTQSYYFTCNYCLKRFTFEEYGRATEHAAGCPDKTPAAYEELKTKRIVL